MPQSTSTAIATSRASSGIPGQPHAPSALTTTHATTTPEARATTDFHLGAFSRTAIGLGSSSTRRSARELSHGPVGPWTLRRRLGALPPLWWDRANRRNAEGPEAEGPSACYPGGVAP